MNDTPIFFVNRSCLVRNISLDFLTLSSITSILECDNKLSDVDSLLKHSADTSHTSHLEQIDQMKREYQVRVYNGQGQVNSHHVRIYIVLGSKFWPIICHKGYPVNPTWRGLFLESLTWGDDFWLKMRMNIKHDEKFGKVKKSQYDVTLTSLWRHNAAICHIYDVITWITSWRQILPLKTFFITFTA